MVQYRAIDRRISAEEMVRQFQNNAASVQEGVLKGLADEIAQGSAPTVDTGTYARSHRVGIRSGSFVGTKPKTGPRGQKARGRAFADIGLNQMYADIDGLLASGKPTNNVVFRNEAAHAKFVEYGGRTPQGVATPAYRVYAVARNKLNVILSGVLAELGFRS